MLDQAYAFIRGALVNNQFLSGGFVLMVGGFLINWARKFPDMLRTWLLRWFTTEVDVMSRDPAFWWVQEWMASQAFAQRTGRLSAATRYGDDDRKPTIARRVFDDEAVGPPPPRPRVWFSPAPGGHWFRYRGCWVHGLRERPDLSSKQSKDPLLETLSLRFWSRDRGIARSLFDEARDFALPPEDRRASIYGVRYDDWSVLSRTTLRGPSSVILADGLMKTIVDDVDEFLGSEQWYSDRNLPYHRGYLLHGPPGNGKSSAIAAVASHLGYNLATLNLGSANLSDETIRALFSQVPPRSLLVVEDIDRDLSGAREDGQVDMRNDKLTFSALLNLLDGIGTPEGRILFMTTNHRDRIDPAMLRPGRCDREFEFRDATPAQARQLFIRFFPGEEACADQFAAAIENLVAAGITASMAKLQGHLLCFRSSAAKAAEFTVDSACVPLHLVESHIDAAAKAG